MMKSNGYTEKELSEVFAFQSFCSEFEVLFLFQFFPCITVKSMVQQLCLSFVPLSICHTCAP